MKRPLAITAIAVAGLFAIPSCNQVDTEGKTRIIQDSIGNVLPTWQALKIHVENNQSDMKIVVGDASFYKAPEDVKKQKADELARMILRIYGPGNYLEKGELIVTANTANSSEAPPDGISIPINFAEIKKGNK